MPSITHEAPIELIRQHPGLALELLQATTEIKIPADVKVTLGATDMSAVVPVQYTADMVVVISDEATKEPVLTVIVEPQLRDEETKRFSWPVYVTTARRANKCPAAVLLVICPDPVEAEKCRQVIRTGHPGFDLIPVIIDPLTSPGQDGGSPYLTVFAACMGAIDVRSHEGAHQVLSAIRDAAASVADQERMFAIIMSLAPDDARLILEAMMATTEFKTTWVNPFREEGREEGRKEGLADGLLKILKARGLVPSDKQRELIESCSDSGEMDRWYERAVTAKSVEEVFAG
jgi:hypothetical protein